MTTPCRRTGGAGIWKQPGCVCSQVGVAGRGIKGQNGGHGSTRPPWFVPPVVGLGTGCAGTQVQPVPAKSGIEGLSAFSQLLAGSYADRPEPQRQGRVPGVP